MTVVNMLKWKIAKGRLSRNYADITESIECWEETRADYLDRPDRLEFIDNQIKELKERLNGVD